MSRRGHDIETGQAHRQDADPDHVRILQHTAIAQHIPEQRNIQTAGQTPHSYAQGRQRAEIRQEAPIGGHVATGRHGPHGQHGGIEQFCPGQEQSEPDERRDHRIDDRHPPRRQ